MDALILSCGTGGGHNSAGAAIAEELTRRGHRAVMINPYMLHSKRVAGWINRLYIILARKAPEMFGALYGAGELYRRLPFRSPVYFANRGMIPVMQEYLSKRHFDVIIMPHLFPAEILTNMKEQGISLPATIFVATDYICIPFTEETDCDAYVIPSEGLEKVFVDYGLPAEKLHPLGIPVQSRFREKEDREKVRIRLGLEPDKKYILIAGGSMGGGKIRRAVQILADETADRKDTELIVICGNNRRLYRELKAKALPGMRVLGYTGDMAAYMKAADLFITKPGGLSSTEAAVCGVPMVHVAAIPGCEIDNARYFSSRGMSRSCPTSRSGMHAAVEMLDDRKSCETMLQRQQELVHPDAAAQICELAERLSQKKRETPVKKEPQG